MALRQMPLVMGVVNVTPDSFSDGGRYLDPAAAIDHGLALAADGADLLDVGGEATNPRAAPIDAREELRRVLPVIEALAAAGATVSIDTTKAEVARAAVAAGAAIVNDVSGGLFDPAMAEALADLDATYIAGHLRGASLAEVFAREPAGAPPTWAEVAVELGQRLAALPPAVRARAWVDPGVGFGKGADPEANLGLLRRAGELRLAVRRPVVVGPSRKRFLRRLLDGERGGAVAGAVAAGAAVAGAAAAGATMAAGAAAAGATVADVTRRSVTAPGVTAPDVMTLDAATVGACLAAVRGGAQVLRVHNVALLRAALAVYTKI
jgi:dihydropteroate synthase